MNNGIKKDEEYFLNFVEELANSKAINGKYNSKLEEIAIRVFEEYKKIFSIEKAKASLEETSIEDLEKKVIVRIIEILSYGISRETDGDHKKGIEELYKKGVDLSGFYSESKTKLRENIEKINEMIKKHNNGIRNSIQLSDDIKNLLLEIQELDYYTKPDYDEKINFNLFPIIPTIKKNTESETKEEETKRIQREKEERKIAEEKTIGHYLDEKRKLVFELGSMEIFAKSVPQDVYNEINDVIGDGASLLIDLNFSLIKQTIITKILKYIGDNEGVFIDSNAFPTDDDVIFIDNRINKNNSYKNEKFLELLKKEIFDLLYDEDIVKQYNSKILEDYYKNWLENNVLQCFEIVFGNESYEEKFYTFNEIKAKLNPILDPGYDRIEEIQKFDQKYVKKLKKKKNIINLLRKNNDYIYQFVNNFGITNILRILEEGASKKLIGKVFETLVIQERYYILCMYLGYGFNELGDFEKVLNIDNSPFNERLTKILDDLILSMPKDKIKKYKDYLNEQEKFNYGERLHDLKYEARYEKEGIPIDEFLKK